MDFEKYENIETSYHEEILDSLREDLTVLRAAERNLEKDLKSIQVEIASVKSQRYKYLQEASDACNWLYAIK
jgi:uncharacterized protein YjaG (DUF416 family)